MPKKIISLTLSEDCIEQIDKVSKALGINRSELIELMIRKGFHFSEDVESELRKVSELQKKLTEKIVRENKVDK